MGKGASMEFPMIYRYPTASWLLLCACAILLGLQGCAGAAATAITDAQDLHDAAKSYVEDNHDLRRKIRAECEKMLFAEVDRLRAEGKYDEARKRLDENYPDLVTIDIVKAALDENKTPLSDPFGCN